MVLFHFTRGISGFRFTTSEANTAPFHFTRGIARICFTTPEAFGRSTFILGAMGRALLASDVEAGPKDPAGSLIFREQFSFAASTGLLADCWATDFENSPPIRRVAA